jgi:hypothetical protein
LTSKAAPKPEGLQSWQFFVLAALGCATAATFMARGQGVMAVILLTVMMATVALVGLAAVRMLNPLVSPDDDRTVMIGQRTRAALEREKMLALRAIKELEFDRAMGKLSEEDFREMSNRLRARAARLMRQLDAGGGYREQIERDLAKKLGSLDLRPKSPLAAAPLAAAAERTCVRDGQRSRCEVLQGVRTGSRLTQWAQRDDKTDAKTQGHKGAPSPSPTARFVSFVPCVSFASPSRPARKSRCPT